MVATVKGPPCPSLDTKKASKVASSKHALFAPTSKPV